MDRPAGEAVGECPRADELALLQQWNTLQAGFRRMTDQLLRDVEERADLAPSSFQALWFLLTAPGQSAPMNQLAETLGFTTAGTTKVADRLSYAGLIERRPLATDRRVIMATLTDQGRDVAGTAARTLAGSLRERLVEPLGAQRFADLADTIGSLGDGRGCGVSKPAAAHPSTTSPK